MIELNRRHLLAGGAAMTASALAPFGISPGEAAVPLSGKQAPSFYRTKLGSFEITVVNDGIRVAAPPENFIRNVSREQMFAVAEAAYMPKGNLVTPFNPVIVNTGSKLVLIDTGFGAGVGPTVGLLQSTMAAAGIDPKAIDTVIISHMHGDHILGVKNADGSLAFPNAEIKVPAVDWAFWMSDENMAKAQDGFTKGQMGLNRKIFSDLKSKVTPYEWGKEVAPGITSVDAKGHTPGHSALVIASGSSRVMFQADLTNVPELFLRNPEWQVMFDNDAAVATATRKRIYDMAAAEKMSISGYHFPFPSLGHVEKDGAGYRLVPVSWNPVL